MSTSFRGGNSRQLARGLDQYDLPLGILDSRGVVLFVNSALCHMANVDSTLLAGKQCRWEAAEDSPVASLLTALAPPTTVREGNVYARQLTTPIIFGSQADGQLFLPLVDSDGVVHATIVVFGNWQQLSSVVPQTASSTDRRRDVERVLVACRSQWKQLDSLHALLGESPAIKLALARVQLAIKSDCSVWISGPTGVGKTALSEAIFCQRMLFAGEHLSTGTSFPIDCQVLDADLIGGMLEVFEGRLRHGRPNFAQQLVLEHIDHCSEAASTVIDDWLNTHSTRCSVITTSRLPAERLMLEQAAFRQLVGKLSTCPIDIPSLANRREDILPLAQHAVAICCREADRAILNIAPEAQDLLESYPWPQNWTQLKTAISEAVSHAVLTKSIQTNHLPVEVRTYAGVSAGDSIQPIESISLDQLLEDLERVVIRRAMKLSPRNRAQVARWLQISRPRLLRRIEQLGLGEKNVHEDDES